MKITLKFYSRIGEEPSHSEEIEHPNGVSVISLIADLKERKDFGNGWPNDAQLVTADSHGHPIFRLYRWAL